MVISSMSSQIYNQEALNKPLKHVRPARALQIPRAILIRAEYLQVFYNSSKAAVSSMSKALAAEWAPYVPVIIITPVDSVLIPMGRTGTASGSTSFHQATSRLNNPGFIQRLFESSTVIVYHSGAYVLGLLKGYRFRITDFILLSHVTYLRVNDVLLIQYSDPQEQTSQVLLLLSEYSSYQTGSEVFIDGGYLIW